MELSTPRNRYIAVLTAVAILILVVGWQLRPRKNSQSPLSQADLTRLARLSQKNNLDGMSSFFSELARQVSLGLVWVEGLEKGGLVWDASGSVFVPASLPNAHQRAWLRAGDESELPLQTELYSAPLAFHLLKSPPELALSSLRLAAGSTLRQGNWLLRVWRTSPQSYEFEPGLFSALQSVVCGGIEVREILSSSGASERTLGSGMFDLDGRLVGVTLLCGSVPRVILAESLSRAIDRGRAVDSQIQFRYGFLPTAITPPMAAYFGVTDGLLVQEVWRDTLAWDLGVRPGDVIAALDDDSSVTLDDLSMMTVPMFRPEYVLTLKRGGASRKVTFPPGAGLAKDPSSSSRPSLLFESPSAGSAIRQVNPGSVAARAGLRAGDRLISMGPQFGAGRVDPAKLNADRSTPVFVVAERGERLIGFFLE